MARPSIELISCIRAAARKIEVSEQYQWGHMGACNCGFLAQEVTRHSKDEIHRSAMMRHGDWSEQLNDYCPTSGLSMDNIISDLVAIGFDIDDLRHLEYLSDQEILRSLPQGENNLHFNIKAEVVQYLYAWADLLEGKLLQDITIPEFSNSGIPA